MPLRCNIHLSPSSVQAAIAKIQQYRMLMQAKCEDALRMLADRGIWVARRSTGEYADYIVFTKEFKSYPHNYYCSVVATNLAMIKAEWITLDGLKSVDVSPLLMAEFGAGAGAEKSNGDRWGLGRGSFPGQTHADEPGWWYLDAETMEWEYSTGVTPGRPMFNAFVEMHKDVQEVFRKAFS